MEDKKQILKIDWKKLVGKCKDLCHRKDRLLIILLTGILLLVIAVPFSGEGDAEMGLMHSGKTKDPSDNTSNEMAGNGNEETYADYLETGEGSVGSTWGRTDRGYDHHGIFFRKDSWRRQ